MVLIGNMQLIHHLLMHPCHPGMHIAIDSYPFILSFELKFFVC